MSKTLTSTYLRLTPDTKTLLSVRKKKLRKRLFTISRGYYFKGTDSKKIDSLRVLKDARTALAKAHEEKIGLATDIAKELVHAQLVSEPQLIVAMASRLLKNISEHSDVEIKANPIDAEVLIASISEINQASSTARKITVSEDKSIYRGSLIINANKSIIDAQVKTQCERAKELLLMGE